MSPSIITFLFLFAFLLSPFSIPALPNPDPAPLQTQTLHRPPPATIPAFPEQSATIPAFPEQSAASTCPLNLSDDLFHGIKSACGTKPHHRPDPNSYSGQLHRSRCCPVLAAWLYSAYSATGLSPAARSPPQTAAYDMPVLPDDSETCVETLEKALGNRGIELRRPNETCDVVYCYCGIRLHPFSCPEAFGVNARGELVGRKAVKKLERDCFYGGGLGGCSKCLTALNLLNGDKSGRSNKTERTSKMHDQDCELMGISWLLNKDRSSYIHTVSAVLRALIMNTNDAPDPTFCSLNTDGMPLAVDSSQISNQSSSTITLHHYFLPFSFLYMIAIFFLVTPY